MEADQGGPCYDRQCAAEKRRRGTDTNDWRLRSGVQMTRTTCFPRRLQAMKGRLITYHRLALLTDLELRTSYYLSRSIRVLSVHCLSET
jgi:hypothetical protein